MHRASLQKWLYLRKVKRSLVCSRSERKRFLTRAEQAIDAFLEDYPDAGLEKWHELLGTPEEFAAQLMGESNQLDSGRHVRHHMVEIAVFSIVLCVAFVYVSILAYQYRNANRSMNIRKQDYTVVVDAYPTPRVPNNNEVKITYSYEGE